MKMVFFQIFSQTVGYAKLVVNFMHGTFVEYLEADIFVQGRPTRMWEYSQIFWDNVSHTLQCVFRLTRLVKSGTKVGNSAVYIKKYL
mgnify:CR=1 FL=1